MTTTASSQTVDVDSGTRAGAAVGEAARRRSFAVISHPDAGKSTLTEALALHAQVISQAGAVHGKAGRRGTVSDWMEMERSRGISITSAALQFSYRDHVVNLLDTPGHADFSEDTYRVLAAVDSAVMLIDVARNGSAAGSDQRSTDTKVGLTSRRSNRAASLSRSWTSSRSGEPTIRTSMSFGSGPGSPWNLAAHDPKRNASEMPSTSANCRPITYCGP